ncbi:MAG: PKD domain-containing protein [Lewinellaceae bacterium]|nr:PKD domain-containing protein [Lewinellaceae bacterium]
MARFNTRDDLRIFDFDRCNGVLSNPLFISVQDDADNNLYAGLAWSADGHYLYAAEIKRILQFDMWASDIAASKSIVAERDTEYSCPFEVNLAYLELGPDGYIYGRSLGGQNCMHRIKYPERSGVACEVQQHYYSFDYPYVNLPHFPNFRLGPVDGSPCDTLGLDNHPLAGWRYDRTGGTSVDFTSVSWYEPDAWLWDFGDGTQSTERNPAHVFPGPGAYVVCLQVSNQYGSDTKCKTVWVTTVGTDSPEEENAITLFPNPATNTVYWRGTGSELINFKLFNQLGQLKFFKETDEGFAQLSSIIPGFYTVQILSQEGTL